MSRGENVISAAGPRVLFRERTTFVWGEYFDRHLGEDDETNSYKTPGSSEPMRKRGPFGQPWRGWGGIES